ncbi:MAG: GrdX family protein [Defluviitaleaceae bacterium]|nr:GrdX family protein [Defluviitaleaceae bacterium]
MNILVTNNPLCKGRLGNLYDVRFSEVSALEILKCARGFVHLGHSLITHPTAGGLPPGHSPYKSIVITAEATTPNLAFINAIEHTIAQYEKSTRPEPKEHLEDFAALDFALVCK